MGKRNYEVTIGRKVEVSGLANKTQVTDAIMRSSELRKDEVIISIKEILPPVKAMPTPDAKGIMEKRKRGPYNKKRKEKVEQIVAENNTEDSRFLGVDLGNNDDCTVFTAPPSETPFEDSATTPDEEAVENTQNEEAKEEIACAIVEEDFDSEEKDSNVVSLFPDKE